MMGWGIVNGLAAVVLAATMWWWPSALLGASLCAAILGLLAWFCAQRFSVPIAVSVLSLALGVGSLIAVLGVIRGATGEMLGRLARLNGHVLVAKYGLDFSEYERIADDLLAVEGEAIAASPYARGAAAIAVPGTSDGEAAPPAIVVVKGVLPHRAREFTGFEEMFVEGDLERGLRPANALIAPGCALGVELADRLAVGLGDTVVLVAPAALDGNLDGDSGPPRRAELEVGALVSTGIVSLDERLVVTHLTAAQYVLFGKNRVSGIEFEVADPDHAKAVAERFDTRLNADRHDRLYITGSWEGRGEGTLEIVMKVRVVATLVLGLILLVASGSLVGALLLTLRRNRRSIAVLSTLGATRGRIFWIFEATGVVVGLWGTALGVALGSSLVWVIAAVRLPLDASRYPIQTLPAELSLADAAPPCLFALGLCMLVTGPVARAAARVRPLDALRGPS